jgi:hypothetical protein
MMLRTTANLVAMQVQLLNSTRDFLSKNQRISLQILDYSFKDSAKLKHKLR